MGRRSLLAAILAVAALAAGCAGQDSAGAASEGRLAVVATTTQLTDFTRNVGGDRIELTGILKPNVDAHDFEPTPADIEAIGSAEVLVTNGVGLESWLDDAVESSGFDGTRVDTSKGVNLLRSAEDAHAEEEGAHAEEEGAHAEEEGAHAEEEGAHTEEEGAHAEEAAPAETPGEGHAEEGHEHGEYDPHIWQNPENAQAMVRNIERALSGADPEGADTYRSNADAYVRQLQELDADVEEQLSRLTNRKLVTNHEAFNYYCNRYNLEFIGSIIPSFDTQAELSAQEINHLVEEIHQTGVKAVFSETSLPPQAAETIAGEAGVKVVTGEDALYGDSLGPAGSAGATYIDAIRHNTETIVANLS